MLGSDREGLGLGLGLGPDRRSESDRRSEPNTVLQKFGPLTLRLSDYPTVGLPRKLHLTSCKHHDTTTKCEAKR